MFTMYWVQRVIGFIIILKIVAENCDKLGILVYEDLGCTPVYNSKPCPIKYKCENWEKLDTNKCHYKGKSYNQGEELPDTGVPCNNECSCTKIYDNTTSIGCVMWACDDIFLLRDPKCSVTHSLDGCCANGVVCPPFENVATCDFNGQKYHEGKRFYPTNSCHKCICQKGFTGKIETPFCARLTCGVQLKWSSATKPKEYCAPFYGNVSKNDALCCPEDWICPDGSEIVKESAQSDESCRFGSKYIKLGEKIEKRNFTHSLYGTQIEKIQCECNLPPLLTCKEM